MDSTHCARVARRDARLIEALNAALHALVVHDGMRVRSEGDEWTLNFRLQFERVRPAMEMLGVNTSEPLIAPPLESTDESDDDDA